MHLAFKSSSEDPFFWSELRIKNSDRHITISNLKINSVFNKFDQLKAMIEGNVDILIVTETKLDSAFPTSQFYKNGFTKPYRLDRSRNGGGVLIYIREDMPGKGLESSSEWY